MKTNSNDPVNPSVDETDSRDDGYGQTKTEFFGHNGLTKREYFAAMAMQAMIVVYVTHSNGRDIAEVAIKQADVLIAELNKEPSDED